MENIIAKILYYFHNLIFPKQLAFGVFFLNLFGNKKYCIELKEKIQYCSENTVGFHLKEFMERNSFDFVPWYENHDMKHVILEYEPTAIGENYMQAFMIGNSGFRPITTLLAIAFYIWTPDIWKDLPYHFIVGRLTKPVNDIKIDDAINKDLELLRQEIGIAEARIQADYIWQVLVKGNNMKPVLKV